MPHAPSLRLALKNQTASLRQVGGFPASVFTAIPVDSGSSDYYGGCVALPTGCGFRQSPVAYIKHELFAFSVIRFSYVTFAIFPYLEALYPEYHTLVYAAMTSVRTTCVSVPFTRRLQYFPVLAINQAV